MGGRSERCRRLVRHTLRRDIGYPEPYRARLTPRSPIRGALWRQDYLAKAIGAKDEFAGRVRVRPLRLDSERFRVAPRTSQSLRARLRVRETGCIGMGRAHVSPETTRIHHVDGRGGCMAARRSASSVRYLLADH